MIERTYKKNFLFAKGNAMVWLIAKYAITAGMVILISEVAKRSDRLGGLIAALPMFLAFPILYQRYGFWLSLAICCIMTILIFLAWAVILRHFGIDLM